MLAGLVGLASLSGLASGCALPGSGQRGQPPRTTAPGRPPAAASATSPAAAGATPPRQAPDASASLPEPLPTPPSSPSTISPPVAAIATPGGESPERSFLEPLGPLLLEATAPAMLVANLLPSACRQELADLAPAVKVERRGYPHVAFPVRIVGSLRGVRIRTAAAPSKYGVLDCRLALAFDAMATILAEHQVAEMRVGTIYRPGARIRGGRTRSQHAYGLAADVVALVRTDGRVVPVEGSWGAEIGQDPCGPSALMRDAREEVLFMRNAICALARGGAFHHILTPSSDRAHHNHIHLDIQRDARNRWIR